MLQIQQAWIVEFAYGEETVQLMTSESELQFLVNILTRNQIPQFSVQARPSAATIANDPHPTNDYQDPDDPDNQRTRVMSAVGDSGDIEDSEYFSPDVS